MTNLQEGTFLQGGKYKILKVLGQGSFGITYLAEHTNLGKKVAVKEFFMKELNSRADDGSITGMSDSSLSYNYCQKFKKEAINLSNLDHPNIVRVTDSFGENGTFYYVMDFIDGQNLNDYIKKHSISEGEAVNIIKCVADALAYMHDSHHMLHLDLKPGNIMRRNSDGHIFLIDFGLSKHYDKNGTPDTSTTIGLGTAGYAPIEQANQARNGEFRPTIDIYALGATLYKLLAGETPPEASVLVSDSKLVENNLRAKNVSENLIAAVSSAMRPNVYERTQTVREFMACLEVRQDEEETIVAKLVDDTPAAKRAKEVETARTLQKSKADKYALVACVLVLLVIGAVLIFSSRGAESLPDTVNNERMTINGNLCRYGGSVKYNEEDSTMVADGVGEAVFDNGCYYKGPFSNGLMHGDSAYYKYANGDTFSGSFANNLFAKGTYTIKESGEHFTGTFDNHGQPKKGTWYDKNNNVLETI